jgi:hypothetical protein
MVVCLLLIFRTVRLTVYFLTANQEYRTTPFTDQLWCTALCIPNHTPISTPTLFGICHWAHTAQCTSAGQQMAPKNTLRDIRPDTGHRTVTVDWSHCSHMRSSSLSFHQRISEDYPLWRNCKTIFRLPAVLHTTPPVNNALSVANTWPTLPCEDVIQNTQ